MLSAGNWIQMSGPQNMKLFLQKEFFSAESSHSSRMHIPYWSVIEYRKAKFTKDDINQNKFLKQRNLMCGDVEKYLNIRKFYSTTALPRCLMTPHCAKRLFLNQQ